MKKRTKKVSVRTTEKIEKLILEVLRKREYKYYTKSDVINMILEENIEKYIKKAR